MTPEDFVRKHVPGAGTISRRRSAYATSHRLEEVEVERDDGSVLSLVLKRSGTHDLLPEARGTRPDFLVDPGREQWVYVSILAQHDLGTARLYGSAADPAGGDWLLLERVPGVELFQIGDRTLWDAAARCLARMHTTLADHAATADVAPLIRYDADFYRRWPVRAAAYRPALDQVLGRLTDRWEELVERLVALPRTVIHGDFYASNVFVGDGPDPRVCPIDWEMAAVGPGLVDLAALTSGWPDDGRNAIADAYRDELGRLGSAPEPAELGTALIDCRLYLAVQWLGWAPAWLPPPEHATDWLAEAVALTEARGW